MSYLDSLNPAQKEAVTHIEGPLMVIAGPGSGKTRVLTYRTAFLIEQGIEPFNILALTFTNKASREMRKRIEEVVGPEARNVWMGTFHSVFARILRIEHDRIGFPANFTIYDTEDSRKLIKNLIREYNLNDQYYKPNTVHNRISSAKNSLITPSEYMADVNVTSEDEAAGKPKLGMLYDLYQRRLFRAGAMDFDDLLMKMHQMLQSSPEALYKYQNKFRFILIDEYQDTNHAQYSIVKLLGHQFENICVVGDDAQSIYSFRGANIHNILSFEKDYPDVKVVKLEQNYRSTQKIVNIANDVIMNNKLQLNKTIWTQNDTGTSIRVLRAMSDNEEGRIVADNIHEESLRNHHKHHEFAILYRTNAQSRAFEESLRRLNIPYRVYGGISFYQRKEIKDLMAYLKLIVNPKDEEALRRIVNYPPRGIGPGTLDRIVLIADSEGKSLWEVMERVNAYGQQTRVANAVEEFVNMIRNFQLLLGSSDAYGVASEVAKRTGLLKQLKEDETMEGVSRMENVQELLNSIKEFCEGGDLPLAEMTDDKSLGAYLQQVALLTDADEKKEDVSAVSLMTIHSAKGLEFPVVYVVGLEENLFPSLLSLESREDLEEERRLFYVAITRAMKKLNLSYATTRYKYGQLMYCEPSRFLEEIPEQHLEFPAENVRPQPVMSGSDRDYSRVGPRLLKRKPERELFNYQPSPNFKADDPELLREGMEVEHVKFGHGKVQSIEGSGNSRIATIVFDKAGDKRIMLKYAKVMIVGPSTNTESS